jgi:hypothetical protein
MEGPREAEWAWSASSDTKTNDGNGRSELFEKSRENARAGRRAVPDDDGTI